MQNFKKPYLPDYFDEATLTEDEKVLVKAEKALQKAERSGTRAEIKVLMEECLRGWRKFTNTAKMQEGRKVSEYSYQLALTNLERSKGNVQS